MEMYKWLYIHFYMWEFFNTFSRTCHKGYDDIIKPKIKIIEVKNR